MTPASGRYHGKKKQKERADQSDQTISGGIWGTEGPRRRRI
jgi:hypothetical protein